MKFLFVTPRLPWPPTDGGAIAMHQTISALHGQGHAVTIASLNPVKHRVGTEALQAIADVQTQEADTTPTAWGALGAALFHTTPYPVLRYLHAEFSALLQRLVTQNQFNIIQLETIFMLPYVDVLRRYSRAPIVLRAHNVEGEIWKRLATGEPNPFKKVYYLYLGHAVTRYELNEARFADSLITLTESDKNFFVEGGYAGPVTVAPPFVETAQQVDESGDRLPNQMAYLGALNWPPNVQGLTWFVQQVWPLICARQPDTQFHIAGKDPLPEVFKLNGNGVVVHGPVADAQQFLKPFEMVIVPVLAGSGIRLKLLEAMALGKAVVTTTVGAQGLGAQPDVHLLIADEPAAFANHITTLLADDTRRKFMGQQARQFVLQHHAQEPLMARLLHFYGSLAPKR